MHDPMTVAFEIRYPWRKYGKRGQTEFERMYRASFITIWHKDPEKDGTDDSCGWSRPRLSKEQRKRLEGLAWSEAREPWFQRLRSKSNDDPVQAEALLRAALYFTCRAIGETASVEELTQWAILLVHSHDNYRGALCHLPGWHTNSEKDDNWWREETAGGLFCGLARFVLRERRPWYKHPRWHVWHWRLQLHPWQNLRRRLWDKCCKCGKRGFPKGVGAMGDWSGTRLWHDTCDESRVAAKAARQ